MNANLLAATLFSVAGGPAAAGGYNLHLEEAAGLRTMVVVDAASGAVAVATGGGDLRVVDDDAARPIMAAAFPADPCNAARALEAGPAKIVIHKMHYDEDPADVRSDKQVRLARPDRFAAAPDVALERPDAGAASRIRTLRVLGGDAEEARAFIESAEGLDPEEIAAMKEAVGL